MFNTRIRWALSWENDDKIPTKGGFIMILENDINQGLGVKIQSIIDSLLAW